MSKVEFSGAAISNLIGRYGRPNGEGETRDARRRIGEELNTFVQALWEMLDYLAEDRAGMGEALASMKKEQDQLVEWFHAPPPNVWRELELYQARMRDLVRQAFNQEEEDER